MTSATIPIRGQMSATVTRRHGESWEATHQRAAVQLAVMAHRRGANGVVGLSVAALVGDVLRVTGQPGRQ